ncbi:MAG: peptidoglycan editing factor PgeF [Alphaproteobacteria bacterium]|nr:peptidoglycan editing factor PgeF [Alphaproteobacteria bacterium]
MISVSALNDVSRVRHGFFTRQGGISEGIYESLNCGYGSGDDAAKVTANRKAALAVMEQPLSSLVTVRQEHTIKAIAVDAPFAVDQRPVADALVTDRKNLVLGVLTADCAPVLFADGKAGVIGAAHAGWRGALAGILESTLKLMTDMGAKHQNIVVGIGPSITRRSYEVNRDFLIAFMAETNENGYFFQESVVEDRYKFDLPGYISRKLSRLGVSTVTHTPCDTCLEADRFFSYRRSCLLGEENYGRQLSAIVLEE